MLEVRDWNAYNPKLGREVLKDIDFKLRKGEIVGFAGLMGSGRTELARSIFGNPDGFGLRASFSEGREAGVPNPGGHRPASPMRARTARAMVSSSSRT